ncbi:hypothetical protein [Streptomyces sp. NPDC048508]|uniref:hypothetical protein n=1 Tax=Streptomyces sp. NPDC048508 TaxID=3365561 RepID=UPI0037180A1A
MPQNAAAGPKRTATARTTVNAMPGSLVAVSPHIRISAPSLARRDRVAHCSPPGPLPDTTCG